MNRRIELGSVTDWGPIPLREPVAPEMIARRWSRPGVETLPDLEGVDDRRGVVAVLPGNVDQAVAGVVGGATTGPEP
jgi:hypothetical protein